MEFNIDKVALQGLLDSAVESKRTYWGSIRDIELMFSDDDGNVPDDVASNIEEAISNIASTDGEVRERDADYLLWKITQPRPY